MTGINDPFYSRVDKDLRDAFKEAGADMVSRSYEDYLCQDYRELRTAFGDPKVILVRACIRNAYGDRTRFMGFYRRNDNPPRRSQVFKSRYDLNGWLRERYTSITGEEPKSGFPEKCDLVGIAEIHPSSPT